MIVTLRPEHEQIIDQAIRAGIIERPDEAVEVGLEALRSRLQSRIASSAPMTAEQWKRELHEWIGSHSTTAVLSDEAMSRGSIYEDRGLQWLDIITTPVVRAAGYTLNGCESPFHCYS